MWHTTTTTRCACGRTHARGPSHRHLLAYTSLAFVAPLASHLWRLRQSRRHTRHTRHTRHATMAALIALLVLTSTAYHGWTDHARWARTVDVATVRVVALAAVVHAADGAITTTTTAVGVAALATVVFIHMAPCCHHDAPSSASSSSLCNGLVAAGGGKSVLHLGAHVAMHLVGAAGLMPVVFDNL